MAAGLPDDEPDAFENKNFINPHHRTLFVPETEPSELCLIGFPESPVVIVKRPNMEKTSKTKMTDHKNKIISGIVTARKCDCCGHHEIGITTTGGQYILLKPGMAVEIRVDPEQENGEPAR